MTPPPPVAAEVFGAALPALVAYADVLAEEGTRLGLIGPREAERLWPRHLLNCGLIQTLVPLNVRVLDIGSGAGLPGLVLALARPDLRLVLVDSLLRRSEFLRRTVSLLGVGDRVEVVRARAEELPSSYRSEIVTARAVAPLGRLAGWALPLLTPGGSLLALRGATAAAELAGEAAALHRLGVRDPEVVQCGGGVVDEPTTVVRIRGSA